MAPGRNLPTHARVLDMKRHVIAKLGKDGRILRVLAFIAFDKETAMQRARAKWPKAAGLRYIREER